MCTIYTYTFTTFTIRTITRSTNIISNIFTTKCFKIFYNISLADNISIGLISGGLYEKMITSAAGLVVGVIAFVGYHLLSMMIDKLSFRLETTAMQYLDALNEAK